MKPFPSFLCALLVLAATPGAFGATSCLTAPSSLAGWWPGDGNANDIAGANNGALQGGATATLAGEVGQAFNFDGTNSFVQIPDSPALRPTNLTIEAWVRFTSLDSAGSGGSPAGDQYIVFKQNTRSSDFEGFDLSKTRVAGGDVIRFLVSSATAQLAEIHSATLLNAGVWYHVAAVRGSNFTQLYVNGQLERQTNVAFAQNYGSLPLYFGSSGQAFWDHKFKGALDEVSLYNRALSSNEVAAIYAAGAAGKCKAANGLTMTAQPQSQGVAVGGNAVFTVAASGAPPLSYQWQFNGAARAGATNPNLTLANVQTADAGSYTVVVTNSTASITSVVAVLTVVVPPTITTQPLSQSASQGTSVTFTVAAGGSTPFSYQWQLNSSNISSAAASSYTRANVQLSDAGGYSVVVSNLAGRATSSNATLTVTILPTPPSITGQPQNQTVSQGGIATFAVAANGTPPLYYQWSLYGTNLAGATGSSYTRANAQPADAGPYSVVVSNALSTAVSSNALVTVIVPPTITTQPLSQNATQGASVTFTVAASGTSPFSYQWQLNSSNISSATASSYTRANIQLTNAGSYSVVVANLAGSATSSNAMLTVIGPPGITAQPASQSVAAGTNASFGVTASGTQPLGYQWRFNGANLTDGSQFSGSASPTLLILNAQTANAGGYSVMVTNVAGSATSTVAVLTVIVPGGCLPSSAGLVGWWPGDGSTTDITGTNNGTLQGGATAVAVGEVAQAFSFDGTNSYVQIPDAPALKPTNLTVEAWVNFSGLDSARSGTAPAGDQYIVFKQNAQAYYFEGYSLEKYRIANGDAFMFTVGSASGQEVMLLSKTLVSTSVWYHVAAVRGSNFMQLYVNGKLEGQTNVSFAQNYGTFPLYFGTSHETYWDGKLKGRLDEVCLYNRALTSNEVAAIYSAGAAGKCKGVSGPTITAQPQSQTVATGSTVLFTVMAGGTAPLIYQWQFNGGAVAGATNPTLTLANAQPANAGSYTVVATNSAGSAISAAAVLTVLTPPVMTSQPQSLINVAGTIASFSATATGSAPLSYQWRLNGVNLANGGRISGATTITLTISDVQPSDAGSYTLGVSNAVGVTASAVASLTVSGPPVITLQPASQSVPAGNNVTFTIAASGTAPLGYQWQFNGANLAGATSTSLTLAGVQSANAGSYTMLVTNSAGSATSAAAALAVLTQPVMTSQPQSLIIVAGTSASFSATATGSAPLSYQWRLNGVNLANGGRISGATTTTLTISGVLTADAGNYALEASNGAGTVTSAVAVLTVTGPPTILTQPVSQSVVAGANVSFSVTASGTAPLSYQWRFNGANLSGATSTSLTLAVVQSANAGNYTVVVTNSGGSATSVAAVLTVLPASGSVIINGAQTYQVIDGFGVNANSGSWINNEVQPVLDALIDQAGMTLFLAEFVGNDNWEPANANPGATLTNWTYFDSVYSGPNFQQLWGMMAYLNQRGITSGLMPKFTGSTALWMGGESLSTGHENDYAKMLASALIYARQTQKLQFTEVAPLNEPDLIGFDTGVKLSGASQYVTVVDDLGRLLDANGMSDVRFSGPDLASTSTSWMATMMTDPYFMSKLAHFGLHSYLGNTPDASGVSSFIQQSAYPNTHFWMTEFNVWCQSCLNGTGGDNSWAYASGAAAYLLTLLAEGASAGLVFEAWDGKWNGYNASTGQDAPGTWDFFGLFAVDDINAVNKTYTPRKQFYTVSQITKYVRPGAIRIGVSGASTPLTVLAFYNMNNGQFTLTGANTTSSASTLSCALTSLPAIPSLDLYYTSSTANLSQGAHVTVNNGSFSVVVPADCVFTLTYINTAAGQPALPMITQQPQSQAVAVGSAALFSVTASGTAPLSYQWLANGSAVSGATGSALTLANVQTNNAGNYAAVVANPAGSVTSAVAALAVQVPSSPPAWEASDIGAVWSDNFSRASLGGNWVILGSANASIVNNELRFMQTDQNTARQVYYQPWLTSSDQWTLRWTQQFGTLDAGSVGVGVGLKNFQAAGGNDRGYNAVLYGAGANRGKMALERWDGATQNLVTTGPALTLAAGDIVDCWLTRSGWTITTTASNRANAQVSSASLTFSDFVSPPLVAPTISRICFYPFQGTIYVSNVSFAINHRKPARFVVIGGSIAEGYDALTYAGGFVRVMQSSVTEAVCNDSSSWNSTVDAVSLLPEILAHQPGIAILTIGANDLTYGYSASQWQGNYANLVAQLQAHGVKVKHCLPTPETTTDQRALKTWISATYPASDVIDDWTPLVANGYQLNPAYDNYDHDGVHPNDAGHLLIAQTILANVAGSSTSAAAIPMVVLPPYFTSVALLPDRTLLVSFNAVSSLTYRIEASADLVNWTTLTNLPNPNGAAQFIDTDAINFTQRFYRATALPEAL